MLKRNTGLTMLFNSFEFLYFLIIAWALYYFPPFRRVQIQLLVGESLFFYAWNNPSLLALLAVSIAFNVWLSARRSGDETFVDRGAARHTAKTSLFITFFPHLISGPILRAGDFYPQIGAKRCADIDWWHCLRLLILGFFLKCVVADNLKDVTAEIVFPKFLVFNSLTLLALIFGYSMQIFADFAGYSIIATGLGALFGYRLPENFDFPYNADSLADFWRRCFTMICCPAIGVIWRSAPAAP